VINSSQVLFVLSSVTNWFYLSGYISRQNIRYVLMKMFILSMKFPQHPHKQLGYGIICRFEKWTDDSWSLCSSGALGILGWCLITDVSIKLIDPWRLDGYVVPKRRYPSTKLRHITFKRAKVATTARTKPEISHGFHIFEHTFAGIAHRDIIHRFIGVLVRDELCCCFQQSLMGRGGSVGITARYGLDGFGVRNLVRATFSAPILTGQGLTHLSISWARGLFPVALTTHLPTSSEVKEKYSHSLPFVPSWHFIERTSPSSARSGLWDSWLDYFSEDRKMRTVQYYDYVGTFRFWLVHFWHLTQTVLSVILCLARSYCLFSHARGFVRYWWSDYYVFCRPYQKDAATGTDWEEILNCLRMQWCYMS
jgi:hypothetical protein